MPKEKAYYQKYKKTWEKEKEFKDWLAEVPGEGNESKAFCKYCKTIHLAHRKDLLSHAQTKKHKDSIRHSITLSGMQPLTNFISPTISTQRKVIELRLAAFAAEHSSINAIDHLGSILSTMETGSKVLGEVRLHRTKCTALIKNVISPSLLKDIVADVGDSFFSLIIDESTSIDTKKVLCLIIRYYSVTKRRIVTTFLRLLEIQQGDAVTIVSAIKRQLEMDNLNIAKLIGIGVDGANVMMGKNNSVATKFKEVRPQLVVVRCVCHSLHLAAESSSRALPKHLDFLVRDTHTWFSNSTKRQVEYSAIHKIIANKSPAKIDKLSGTRWLARHSAIEKILEQWDSLKLHFEIAATKERCYTAEVLSKMYKSNENKLFLTFLKHILRKVIDVNKSFQGESVDPLKLFEDLNHLVYSLLQIIVEPDSLQNCSENHTQSFDFEPYLMQTECIYFGFHFNEISTTITSKEKLLSVKERCKLFLISLCKDLQKRLPDSLLLLQKISYFSPKNATSQIKPDINELISHFRDVCEDPDAALQQWNLLHMTSWMNLDSSEKFWDEVYNQKDAAGNKKYGNIGKLATTILSLPFSNASVERAFSIFSVVKNKLRNRMAIDTADSILRVRYSLHHGCQNFTPTQEMLNGFTSAMYQSTHQNEEDENVLEFFQQ